MEEPKPAENTATHVVNPPSTNQNDPPQPPQPPPAAAASLPLKNKKRPLDNNIQDSVYYKMRLIVKDLRPHFIEVLRTPDFRNCGAAEEIREKIKLLMEQYRQIEGEAVSIAKSKNVPESQLLSSENGVGEKQQEHENVKLAEQSQPESVTAKPSEDKPLQSGMISEKPQPESDGPVGSYIVGGSAFGWNFIMFSGSKPVYYGVTKDSFRSAHPISGSK